MPRAQSPIRIELTSGERNELERIARAHVMFDRQPVLPLGYEERRVERAYQPEFVVEGRVVLEIEAVQALLAVHAAQHRTSVKLQRLAVGLRVDFSVPALRDHGIRRLSLSSPPGLLASPD